MGLADCVNCIKYTLFVFNSIFWFLGAAISAIGVYLYVSPIPKLTRLQLELQEHDLYNRFTFALIALGAVIMLISFLGCCGAILENKCMLIVFFVVMTIITLALCAAGAYVVLIEDQVNTHVEKFQDRIKNATEHYNNTDVDTNYADAIQREYKCCGYLGRQDYENQNPAKKLPESCKDHLDKGCRENVADFVKMIWLIDVIVLFSTAFITLIGMALSILLCFAVRELCADD